MVDPHEQLRADGALRGLGVHHRAPCPDRFRREGEPEDLPAAGWSSEPGPSRAAESAETRERLARALLELSDEQREVFLLREYGGLSFKEIAAAQGCPLNTALARMRYALLKLRGRLEACHG